MSHTSPLLMDFIGRRPSATHSIVVSRDAVFLCGSAFSGFSALTANLLKTASRVVSSTERGATISSSGAVNYTGGIREIVAEPIYRGEEDESRDMPSLFSRLTHSSMLLLAAKSNGSWVAAPQNVKKIVPGDHVIATPPITASVRGASVRVRFPDRETRSVVIAKVIAVHDSVFTGRSMRSVSFSGAPGIVCDGLMVYSA